MTQSDYIERDVTDPKGIVQVYRNYWWWCVDGDAKRALFYSPRNKGVGSAQCNSNQAVATQVGKNLGHDTRATLIQIPLAFSPWED